MLSQLQQLHYCDDEIQTDNSNLEEDNIENTEDMDKNAEVRTPVLHYKMPQNRKQHHDD